ncbi:MAG: hypothetical protein PVI90_05000, partial [Desulfobacteraceae bacterium]
MRRLIQYNMLALSIICLSFLILSCEERNVPMDGFISRYIERVDYYEPPDWNAHHRNFSKASDPLNIILSANSAVTMPELKEMLEESDFPWNEVFIGFDIPEDKC